jgi:hypothetical protein
MKVLKYNGSHLGNVITLVRGKLIIQLIAQSLYES